MYQISVCVLNTIVQQMAPECLEEGILICTKCPPGWAYGNPAERAESVSGEFLQVVYLWANHKPLLELARVATPIVCR